MAVGDEHLPGDFNHSGAVDGADYILWSDTFSPRPAAPVPASLPLAAAVPVVIDSTEEFVEAAVAVSIITATPAAALAVPAAVPSARIEQTAAQLDTPVKADASANARPLVIDNLLANEERVMGLIAAIRGGALRDATRVVELPANLEHLVDEFLATTVWTRRLSRRDK